MTHHIAIDIMRQGYTCSESILMAYAPGFGLPPELAARLAGGFAGGLTQGKTCGAVAAAAMVIGLKFGPGLARTAYQKDLCVSMTQELFHRFRQQRQTTECKEILEMSGIDPADPGQMARLRQKGICDKIVRDAAVILDGLLATEG